MGQSMSDEQVKGMPELKLSCPNCGGSGYTERRGFSSAGDMDAGNEPHPVAMRCSACHARGWLWALDQEEMAERIARSEQALAALEARNKEADSYLKRYQERTMWGTDSDNDVKFARAALKKQFAAAPGPTPQVAALEARNKELEGRLKRRLTHFAEALRLVEFYRDVHGCERADICTGCAAASKLLAARAALKGAS